LAQLGGAENPLFDPDIFQATPEEVEAIVRELEETGGPFTFDFNDFTVDPTLLANPPGQAPHAGPSGPEPSVPQSDMNARQPQQQQQTGQASVPSTPSQVLDQHYQNIRSDAGVGFGLPTGGLPEERELPADPTLTFDPTLTIDPTLTFDPELGQEEYAEEPQSVNTGQATAQVQQTEQVASEQGAIAQQPAAAQESAAPESRPLTSEELEELERDLEAEMIKDREEQERALFAPIPPIDPTLIRPNPLDQSNHQAVFASRPAEPLPQTPLNYSTFTGGARTNLPVTANDYVFKFGQRSPDIPPSTLDTEEEQVLDPPEKIAQRKKLVPRGKKSRGGASSTSTPGTPATPSTPTLAEERARMEERRQRLQQRPTRRANAVDNDNIYSATDDEADEKEKKKKETPKSQRKQGQQKSGAQALRGTRIAPAPTQGQTQTQEPQGPQQPAAVWSHGLLLPFIPDAPTAPAGQTAQAPPAPTQATSQTPGPASRSDVQPPQTPASPSGADTSMVDSPGGTIRPRRQQTPRSPHANLFRPRQSPRGSTPSSPLTPSAGSERPRRAPTSLTIIPARVGAEIMRRQEEARRLAEAEDEEEKRKKKEEGSRR
jgi:hypothetical protein